MLARQCGIAEKTLRRAANDLGVDMGHVGERGKKGGGHWVWRLPSEQDGQDGLCDKSGHLAKSGHVAEPIEVNKMVTQNGPVGTNLIKMATPDPQTTLMPAIGQDGHLDLPATNDDIESF